MKKFYFVLAVLCSGFGLNAQIINIPNEYFKLKLTVQSTVYGYAKDINGQSMIVDVNNDGEIEVSEAQAVYKLYVGGSGVDDLTGIEYFTNVRVLWCDSGGIDTLDLSTLTHLKTLQCQNNDLTSLNITGLAELTTLYAYANELTSLDLTGCTALSLLWCFENQLQSIDVTGLNFLNDFRCRSNNLTSLNASNHNLLTHLECDNNQLTNLNVSDNPNLNFLSCTNNQLSNLNLLNLNHLTHIKIANNPIAAIDLTGLTLLEWFEFGGTQIASVDFSPFPTLHYVICNNCSLTTIDVSNNPLIYEINCPNSNSLESIFMKNGRINGLYAENCPLLRYICADQTDIDYIGQTTGSYFDAININSYCSFTPGGNFYTIQGNAKYDENDNGCDLSDVNLPNLKYGITDGTISGNIIPNSTGSYTIPVHAGTHTINPILENPDYFMISPTSIEVSFPTQSSPFIQDFCVSANGIHHDLEVVVIPVTIGRPGFDAVYNIVIKNNGTSTQNGTVNLFYDDLVSDFVNAIPDAANQSFNNLTWNFNDLHPFETIEIMVTLNLNSPVESPSLNSGEVLSYTATITGQTDETPSNNSFVLHQEVVNSLDPNDKTCLEGETVGPEKIGDYVHYMIRFENTGSANAQNIVVKDMIDMDKFDIASLVPLDASHPFVTRIINTNQVEFVFENINLPFDDANNDGYVAFKVRTKSTLAVENTFSNTASIYFDYNMPIVTNTYTTVISSLLGNPDFEFSNYFTLYPNPAKEVLTIKSGLDIVIQSISIYNVLGQLVLVVPNAGEAIDVDVSGLNAGTYVIKINSDKGMSSSKFVKQ